MNLKFPSGFDRMTGRGRWPARILTSQRVVRPSNFQNALFAAVRNAWSTTRAASKFGRNCQSSGLCILDRLSIVLLRSHFIQCSSWYLCQPSAAHPPSRVCRLISATARAMQNFLALGTHPQLVHLQNALFAIIAASYDLFKSMCAHSDYGHKLS